MMPGFIITFLTGIFCVLLVEATGLPNGLPMGFVIAAAYLGGLVEGRTGDANVR